MENNINNKKSLSAETKSKVVPEKNDNVEILDMDFEIEELKLDDPNIKLKQEISVSDDVNKDKRSDELSHSVGTDNNNNNITPTANLNSKSENSPLPENGKDVKSSDDSLDKSNETTSLGDKASDVDNSAEKSSAQDKKSPNEKLKDGKEKSSENKGKERNTPQNKKNDPEHPENKNNANDKKDGQSNSEKNKSSEDKNVPSNENKTPESLQNKRNQVKQNADNKRYGDSKNNLNKPQKTGSLKDRTKNRIRNGVKNAAANSEVGQKVLETKEKIDKAKRTIKTIKKTTQIVTKVVSAVASVIGLIWPFTLIIVIVVVFAIMLSNIIPGTRGKAGDEKSDYSETDLKTLEKIKGIVEDYPSSDASLAMSAVVYPYFDYLWSKKTKDLVSEDYVDELSEQSFQDEELEYDMDTEDIEAEEKIGHDLYLEIFRKSSYRKNFKTLLKKLSSGEETFENYLKTKYFKKETAYKSMTENSPDESTLMQSMIDDIKNNKSLFVNYVFERAFCATTLSSAGTVELDEVLKGNILVDVKVPSCTSGTAVWDCESVYANPISLKQYVFGGTYEEFNSMDVEKTAAQMLAIKSYIVQRGKNMGWGIKQDQNGNYVVTARNNTNDLVYCDVDLGCKSGNTEVGEGNAKRDPITSEQRAVFESAWEKISDKYIYDNESKKTVGSFCQSRSGACDFCTKGSCLAHHELQSYTNTSYEAIIGMQYSNYAIIQVEGEFASAYKANGVDCSNAESVDIDDSKFVYYAQTDYSTQSFCGLATNSRIDALCPKGNTICSHGCGVTSMAMVTATLTQNYSINPLTLNNEVRPGTDCGTYGTSGASLYPYIANKYGLTYSYKANSTNLINDIKTALDEGALIITSVCGGMKINNRYTFGPCGGHFIVIRGYEGDSVIISDPYQNSKLKRYNGCLAKNNDKCIKHKMNFNTFYEDLRAKGGALHIIKGPVPFYQLKNESNTVSATEN